MKKRIPVMYVDTSTYEGGNIPHTLIHLEGVTYYIASYTSPDENGNVFTVLKVWRPF